MLKPSNFILPAVLFAAMGITAYLTYFHVTDTHANWPTVSTDVIDKRIAYFAPSQRRGPTRMFLTFEAQYKLQYSVNGQTYTAWTTMYASSERQSVEEFLLREIDPPIIKYNSKNPSDFFLNPH